LSTVTVASVFVGTGVSIVLGHLGFGISGLLASYISGQLITLVIYGWHYLATFLAIGRLPAASVIALAKRQSNFPLYSLPATVLRSIALVIPSLALAYMGSVDVAGHFSRAQSLLALPIGLIGVALAQAFQEKAAREREQSGRCWMSYKRLLTALAVASPVMFAVIALAAPWLFVIYLGPQWEDTGRIAQLLAPMMCLRMIAGPLWPVFAIYDANRSDFLISLLQFLAMFLLSLAVGVLALSALWQIIVFGYVNSVISILHIVQTYRLVRHEAVVTG
jgi:O-antigen/teichoic acid export membrane protein